MNFIRSCRKMDRTPDFAVLLIALCGSIGSSCAAIIHCHGPSATIPLAVEIVRLHAKDRRINKCRVFQRTHHAPP